MPFQNEGSPRINWCCSYPKSGNTYARLFCAAFAKGRKVGLDQFVKYDDIAEFDFQSVCPIPIGKLTIDAQAMLRPAAMLVLSRKIDGPTLVKSHHACMDVNGIHLWLPQWTGKVVNPVRDPREVCCSARHHFGMESYMETAEFMARRDANIGGDGKLHHFLGSWSDHVRSWVNTERVPVHTVRYRDLRWNPKEEFTEILEFLELPEIPEEQVEFAIEATDFERMQEFEDEHGFPERVEDQDKFFRKGQVDGWKEELPVEVAEKIEDDHSTMMEKFGFFEGTSWERGDISGVDPEEGHTVDAGQIGAESKNGAARQEASEEANAEQ